MKTFAPLLIYTSQHKRGEQQYSTQIFLNLAQSLEAYHKGVEAYDKRKSGKKPNKRMWLKNRLMCLSEPLKDRFDSESIRDEWMTDIKKARDQLTHGGKLNPQRLLRVKFYGTS